MKTVLYETNYGVKPDEKDDDLLQARVELREQIDGPRIGDFVIFPDGTRRRFAHDWGDTIQFSCSMGDESIHLDGNGWGSYSGGLCPGVPKSNLKLANEEEFGIFWFFHHEYATAHNGVGCKIPCRVFRCSEMPKFMY